MLGRSPARVTWCVRDSGPLSVVLAVRADVDVPNRTDPSVGWSVFQLTTADVLLATALISVMLKALGVVVPVLVAIVVKLNTLDVTVLLLASCALMS